MKYSSGWFTFRDVPLTRHYHKKFTRNYSTSTFQL